MIHEKLKALRECVGLSQKEIADFLEISQPMYSHMETGYRKIKSDKLEKLCNLYFITPLELIETDKEELEEKVGKWFKGWIKK